MTNFFTRRIERRSELRTVAQIRSMIFVKIHKNITMRDRFQDDPEKYMRYQARITALTDLRDEITGKFNR